MALEFVALPTEESTPLIQSGEYFLELDAPDRILDAIQRNPNWALAFTRFVLERTGDRLEVLGGGVAYSLGGPERRVFAVRLKLHPKEGVNTMVFTPVTVGLLIAAFLVVLVSVSLVAIYYLRLQIAESPAAEEGAEAALQFGAALKWAVVLGGGYLLLRELT